MSLSVNSAHPKVRFSDEARHHLLAGVNILADDVAGDGTTTATVLNLGLGPALMPTQRRGCGMRARLPG